MSPSTTLKKDIIIDVATGEIKVAKAPAYLQCLALGSCVAVILYDKEHKIGGIAHVMLPSSLSINVKDISALKRANHAIQELVKQMRELRASDVLTARIVGGALVIPNTSDIGKENIEAVRNTLQELDIMIIDEHLGGTVGRSVLFDVTTGELIINGKLLPIETTAPSSREEKKESKNDSSEYIRNLEEKVAERTKELTVRVEELDNVRKATFNLLEDLEKERDRITEARAKDEALLQSIGDGVIATDAEGKIILMNQSAQEMLGWHPEEMVGRLLFDAVPVEDEKGNIVPREKRPESLALAGTTTTTTTTVLYLLSKNKIKFPIAITVSPIILDNKIIGAVEVFRDITKEQQIDKAKTEFVSLASHQLRTPMTAISWYAEMILQGDVGQIIPKQKKYLEEIYQGNRRMVELVNTILDVSRLELGTFKVEPKPTDVIALAQSVLDEQKPKIEKKKLVVTESFSKDVPTFSTDPKLLRMVFQNILANSVEYTPEGGKIGFSVSADTKNVLIEISDTGYGIPKNQQDKVYEKFFRADNVRDKDTEGTGLGLYIVKSIVENSGGKIWFESEENKGTTFYVTLPLSGMTKKEGAKALG